MNIRDAKIEIQALRNNSFMLGFALECLLFPSAGKRFAVIKSASRLTTAYFIGPGRDDGGYFLLGYKEGQRVEIDYLDNAYTYWVNYKGTMPERQEILHHLSVFMAKRSGYED